MNVGILGAGQLSQMLVQASSRLGIRPRVFAASDTDSAALEKNAIVTVGAVTDVTKLTEFLSTLDVCAFESELIDCAAVRRASHGLPVRFIPSLETMERLSEKLEQKRILKNLSIPSAPFLEGPREESQLDPWLIEVKARFSNSFVLKWSKYGYDGRGVSIVRDETEFKMARSQARIALSRGIQLYAEERVSFVRELAVIASHSSNGDFATYPLVISEQLNGVCRRVKGPALSLEVQSRLEMLAVQYAEKLAKALPLHGTFALELFETQDGDLWVNEIAPRVHNSGHYTQDACASDQFENHLRSVTGQMLGLTTTKPFFAMLNLLGPRELQGQYEGVFPTVPADLHFHWYNKNEIFPGRKLGHLNCVADSRAELKSRMDHMEDYEKLWAAELFRKLKGI